MSQFKISTRALVTTNLLAVINFIKDERLHQAFDKVSSFVDITFVMNYTVYSRNIL